MRVYILFIIALPLIFSCEKVINVDLNEGQKKVVILANYMAGDSTVDIQVSQTTNYFGAANSVKINTATITISDQNGNTQTVPFIANGQYRLTNYPGTVGNVYTISVTYNGTAYTSSSTLLTPITLDPITYEFTSDNDPFGPSEEGYAAYVNYNDPVGEANYYQVHTLINHTDESRFVLDDKLNDGNAVSEIAAEALELNDTITLELRTINKNIFDYYTELETITDGNGAAPANPTYQWSNNALGYFSSFVGSKQHIIVQ